jgi:hypothetical protein
MEMKQHRKLLECNPLSDASYRNSGMALNEQGSSQHLPGGTLYLDLDTMLNEQGSGCRILSDTLHRCPSVVRNEQGSSHLIQRMRRVRKLAEPSRLCVRTWNVGPLTGKFQEVVDTMIMRRVNIHCVQEIK